MTEEIIIDGVDVSECIFYKGYCRIAALCDYSGHLCEVTPNCKLKQLKRAEQKLEKVKDYCRKNKVSGWVDVEGIVEIIEGEENE